MSISYISKGADLQYWQKEREPRFTEIPLSPLSRHIVFPLAATSEVPRTIAAVGMSILGNVVIMSVVPVRLGVWLGCSSVATVSIPPGRTITMSRLCGLPVCIVGSVFVIVTAMIAHIPLRMSLVEVGLVAVVAVDVESPAPIVPAQ